MKINEQILIIDKAICDNIDRFDSSERGALSQVILAQLRNFAEHIMLKIYANGQDIDNTYENIRNAIIYTKTRGNLKFLMRFHDFLQIVASHYTIEEESSERLMLKYYEYLLRIKWFLKTQYSLDILGNIDKFPINKDSDLKEYYKKIAEKIELIKYRRTNYNHNDRFYIQKIKPFFVEHKIYYEITFTPANGRASKFHRIIAFTDLEISKYYAAKLYFVVDNISILGKTMPIHIIVNWEVSIRPCELNNFSKIFSTDTEITSGYSEYKALMQFLTETGFNLVEVIDFTDGHFQQITQTIAEKAKSTSFIDILRKSREIINDSRAGSNILRYLLYCLSNNIIKDQFGRSNNWISYLCLDNKCIPFDKMPFNTSLIGHNPRLGDLFECIKSLDRKHEILARYIRNNTEIKGRLYTPTNEIVAFDEIDKLIKTYNSIVLSHGRKHAGRVLQANSDHVYIKEYEEDTVFIIRELKKLASAGISNYSSSVNSWLQSNIHTIDCNEKKVAITQMFEKSMVALIYGSAGTGKSTLINHISHFFSDKTKLYLANTNPAVDNLKRRVDAANCTFLTINKFEKKKNILTDYDVLIIDECSTVSNKDMREVLGKATFKLLVLVGDIYQIESIRFGNWFSAARSFIPQTSLFELTIPYRSKNKDLLKLWNMVRRMDVTILEHIAKKGYSSTLDESIFQRAKDDEIILCLNYDGLYGINNINRFLQQSNPNTPVYFGMQDFKVDDPILFNESERFAPLIYNNMKGRIAGINLFENQIQFDIELDKAINGLDAQGYDFELLGNTPSGNSAIRFLVNKYRNNDEDEDTSSLDVLPFQVAYAVSIHKAQGLEYNSVKIIITDEVDELITHNIFYTAITRAREKLKIYWTPEVEKKVLNSIEPKKDGKDVALLKKVI